MIIINKYGLLRYKNLNFRCALGKAGVGKKRVEGDNITPVGIYKIVKIFYRKDRIKKISSKFKLFSINKNMCWCDDSNSKHYNQLIKLPTNYTHEKLYRRDCVYDLILVLNYNIKPIIKNKGSAIFIHVTKNYKKTAGCIALKKDHLIKLVSKINKSTRVKIA
jgi:L,D-peptidoglycan transpeptidase YkuD (ErfK/YbiS/YcfS/YnhG family)